MQTLLLFAGLCACCGWSVASEKESETSGMSICNPPSNLTVYDFEIDNLANEKTTLGEFRGKPLMIVNVATFCALTKHYLDFNPMLKKYKKNDLHIAGFPCNQFNMQEPGDNPEILNGLKYVRPGNNWEPHENMQIFGKVDVNGKNAHPLYKFLRDSCPQTVETIVDKDFAFWNPITTRDITWNFEKFLIDADGRPRYRFNPHAWAHGATVEPWLLRLFNSSSASTDENFPRQSVVGAGAQQVRLPIASAGTGTDNSESQQPTNDQFVMNPFRRGQAGVRWVGSGIPQVEARPGSAGSPRKPNAQDSDEQSEPEPRPGSVGSHRGSG